MAVTDAAPGPAPGPGQGLRPVTPVAIAAAELATADDALAAGDAPAARAAVGRARALLDGLDPYLAACTSPASPALRALDERTRTHGWDADGALEAEMLSGHVEGRLLALLVRLTGARRVLDVGTFTGYSALAMAEALPADGLVVALELDADVAEVARGAFEDGGVADRVDLRVGPALDALAAMAADGERVDLAFLDADKPGYVGVLEVLLDGGVLRPGGLLCADNTLLQGEPYLDAPRTGNGDGIARFNAAVADDPRLEQVLLPLRDGVTLARLRDDAA